MQSLMPPHNSGGDISPVFLARSVMKVLVSHGNERLIAGQRVAGDEGGRRRVRGIIEPRDHDAGRFVEDASVVQICRRLPVDLQKDVTVHDVADDPARMGVTTRLLCWLQG